MTKTPLPTNFIKHTSKNPIQKFLISNFYSSLISLAKPLSPKTVLDAGCGEGFTMNKLTNFGIGKQVEGVEYSKEAITLGKKLFPDLKFKEGSAYELPYKDNSFDLVVCTEVLEHLDEPTEVLKETIRVSKKNIIISVPNEPFFMLGNFLRGKNLSRLGNDPGHINHWTIMSFLNFLRKNGLKIKTIRLPFPWILILGEK
ncbi:MAG: methyltransferase domain-containing protein [Candidatus Levybacteria bacterium]|nr:methyltransferase domain-containing protein [Candidatus Levybacteria bacterium]